MIIEVDRARIMMYGGEWRYAAEGAGRRIAAEQDFDLERAQERGIRVMPRETSLCYFIEVACRTPKHYCGGV